LKRRIVILNLVLAAVAVFAGVQLRNEWLAGKAREAATLPGPPVKPTAVPPYTALPGAGPVLAAGYSLIPQKFLFDPSRNSTVVEVVAFTPPPPPRPMPALPRFHGEMNLDGIMAVLSETPNSPQRFMKPGETIGEFKLLDVNTQELIFEWDGQTIHKGLNELTDRGAAPPDSRGSPAPARTAPPPPPPVFKTPLGPGQATSQGPKACLPDDSTPDGTVVDGFRKVSRPTPFGAACLWEPVGK
jgi:hypothetical protein